MKKQFLLFLFIFAPAAFAASGGGHGESHGVPWGMILQQLFNLGLAIGLIGYFTSGKIKSYFASRKEDFTQLLRKAEEAKASAEKDKVEITERLTKLTSNSEKTISSAKAEAEQLKQKILNDALTLSQKLESEAHKSASFELERAKLQLRQELLEASMIKSKETLPSLVDGSKASALNQQFIDNLQVSQ